MESGVSSLRLNSKFNSYTIIKWRGAAKIEKMQGQALNIKFCTYLINAGIKVWYVHSEKKNKHKSSSSI